MTLRIDLMTCWSEVYHFQPTRLNEHIRTNICSLNGLNCSYILGQFNFTQCNIHLSNLPQFNTYFAVQSNRMQGIQNLNVAAECLPAGGADLPGKSAGGSHPARLSKGGGWDDPPLPGGALWWGHLGVNSGKAPNLQAKPLNS